MKAFLGMLITMGLIGGGLLLAGAINKTWDAVDDLGARVAEIEEQIGVEELDKQCILIQRLHEIGQLAKPAEPGPPPPCPPPAASGCSDVCTGPGCAGCCEPAAVPEKPKPRLGQGTCPEGLTFERAVEMRAEQEEWRKSHGCCEVVDMTARSLASPGKCVQEEPL